MGAPLVLVHGGAHGAWCWQPTIDLLHARALAIDLPPKAVRGRPNPHPLPPELATLTLDDWTTSALADIDAADIDEFVLVGHSMGGLTIAELARRVPARVRHLAFVSCMVPPEGGLVVEGAPTHEHVDAREILERSTSGDAAIPGLDAASIRHMFCNDTSEEQTRFVLEHTGPEAMAIFGERVTRRGIPPELPKTYVRLLRDQALPPSDQDRAIKRLEDSPGGVVDVIDLDTGHDVMISAPEQLAAALDRITATASLPTRT